MNLLQDGAFYPSSYKGIKLFSVTLSKMGPHSCQVVSIGFSAGLWFEPPLEQVPGLLAAVSGSSGIHMAGKPRALLLGRISPSLLPGPALLGWVLRSKSVRVV